MKKLAMAGVVVSFLLTACGPPNHEDIGTLAGGVVGGLVGSQFGGNSGKVAAAAGGALIGAFLGGNIGRAMDKIDRMEMQRALETAPSGKTVAWKNPDTGNRYTVRPTKTYYLNTQQPCREYVTQAVIDGRVEEVRGTACRQPDGSWKVKGS